MNYTLVAPEGTTNHGNPYLLCIPPKWHDFIIFYFANYFAHAATIVTYPGQGLAETISAIITALLLPASGVGRAAGMIRRGARLAKDPLKQATRAGALCMVVKDRVAHIQATMEIQRRDRAVTSIENPQDLENTADYENTPSPYNRLVHQ